MAVLLSITGDTLSVNPQKGTQLFSDIVNWRIFGIFWIGVRQNNSYSDEKEI